VLPLWLVLLTVPMAAIAGDQVGYFIGKKAGPHIFNRPDSRFFQQEYVDKSYEFFEKYGARTDRHRRFVPIVRTFAPVVAGVSRMSTGPSSPTT
jgi:membrane-associated protein